MSLNQQYDVGARIVARLALGNFATTAGSGGAALTTQDGVTIDRDDGLRGYYSCKAIVSAAFTGGSSQRTGSVALNFQHSSDGTSWDNYSTATVPSAVEWGSTSTGGTTGATGGTEYDTVEQRVSLNGARRYVRIQLPAPTFQDCSSGSILTGHGVIVFGGADENPAND